ncbi:hypothetical protein [Streptomyces sp. NPDC001020]
MAPIEDAWAQFFADALATLPAGHRAALVDAMPALHALGLTLRNRRNATAD